MEKIPSDLIKEFKKDCKIIDLQKEYPQYQGTVKYAVISKLTEDELVQRYGQVLVQYQPYFVLSNDIGDVFHEYWKNEKKYYMRYIRNTDGESYLEGETEQYISELNDNFSEEWILSEYVKSLLKTLTPLEQERLIKRFYQERTLQDIADDYGCSARAIKYSIDFAIKKLKEFSE